MYEIKDVVVNTTSEYIATRVYSQLQTNQKYLNNASRGFVQVDGERIQWLRLSNGL